MALDYALGGILRKNHDEIFRINAHRAASSLHPHIAGNLTEIFHPVFENQTDCRARRIRRDHNGGHPVALGIKLGVIGGEVRKPLAQTLRKACRAIINTGEDFAIHAFAHIRQHHKLLVISLVGDCPPIHVVDNIADALEREIIRGESFAVSRIMLVEIKAVAQNALLQLVSRRENWNRAPVRRAAHRAPVVHPEVDVGDILFRVQIRSGAQKIYHQIFVRVPHAKSGGGVIVVANLEVIRIELRSPANRLHDRPAALSVVEFPRFIGPISLRGLHRNLLGEIRTRLIPRTVAQVFWLEKIHFLSPSGYSRG